MALLETRENYKLEVIWPQFEPKSDSKTVGGLGGTRTPGALLRTEALYPLSYEAAVGLGALGE